MDNKVSVVRVSPRTHLMCLGLSYLLATLAANLLKLRFLTIPTFVNYTHIR